MSDGRPPFDQARAAFYLVAFVIGVHATVVLLGIGACLYYAPEIIEGKAHCNARESLLELLAQTLAAALAFSAGRINPK